MAWYLTVKELKQQLNKYDDDAVLMVGMDRESGETYEADPDVSYAYLTPDGDLVDDMAVENGESVRNYRRALIIWSTDK